MPRLPVRAVAGAGRRAVGVPCVHRAAHHAHAHVRTRDHANADDNDIYPSCVGGRDEYTSVRSVVSGQRLGFRVYEHVRSVVSGQRFDRKSQACLPQNAVFYFMSPQCIRLKPQWQVHSGPGSGWQL